MEIIEKLKVENRSGLSLRASAELVKASSQFKCSISMENHHCKTDAKNIFDVMSLAASYGSEIKIAFEGDDAWLAQKKITELFQNKFGELN